MVEENVNIEIETVGILDGESITNHVKSQGRRYLKNEKIYISYSELIDGIDIAVPSLITLDETFIQISRRGEINSTMKFVPDTDTKCTYKTAVGDIDMLIHTTYYGAVISEDTIEATVEYSIIMNGVDGGHNRVRIVIRNCRDSS